MFNLCSALLSRAAAGAGGRCPVSDHYYQPIQIINTTWITEHAVFNKWTSARFHATCVRAAVKNACDWNLRHQTYRIGLQTTKCKSTETVTAKADDYYTRLRLRTKREVDTSSRRPDVRRSARTHSLTSLRRSRLCNLCSL